MKKRKKMKDLIIDGISEKLIKISHWVQDKNTIKRECILFLPGYSGLVIVGLLTAVVSPLRFFRKG